MAYLINDDIRAQLIAHEGLRLKPYRCTANALTIGVGHNADANPGALAGIPGWKENGITKDQALAILDYDLSQCFLWLYTTSPWAGLARMLSDNRKAVIIDMFFTPGPTKLKAFVRTIQAIKDQDWPVAARQILASRYALQVGRRAKRLAYMMENDADFETACKKFPL